MNLPPEVRAYIKAAEPIPGWLYPNEAEALARYALQCPADATIVEIGSLLGKSTIVLAGARKTQGSGRVHAVDPFDGSGDSFSVPYYAEIAREEPRSWRQRFDDHLQSAGLDGWVDVHVGTAESAAATWTGPVHLLFLDGDQSPAGARSAFEHWEPFLEVGGVIALHNSNNRTYAPGHDGHRRLVVEALLPPKFVDVTCADSTTFARKASR